MTEAFSKNTKSQVNKGYLSKYDTTSGTSNNLVDRSSRGRSWSKQLSNDKGNMYST
jgi:hypothetical protein